MCVLLILTLYYRLIAEIELLLGEAKHDITFEQVGDFLLLHNQCRKNGQDFLKMVFLIMRLSIFN